MAIFIVVFNLPIATLVITLLFGVSPASQKLKSEQCMQVQYLCYLSPLLFAIM